MYCSMNLIKYCSIKLKHKNLYKNKDFKITVIT